MLKWKRVEVTAGAYAEKVESILSGMSGKNRRIIYATIEDKVSTDWFKIYRDAEEIVNIQGTQITDNAPFLPMDLPLAGGQHCTVGFYNGTGGGLTRQISIGYEETA